MCAAETTAVLPAKNSALLDLTHDGGNGGGPAFAGSKFLPRLFHGGDEFGATERFNHIQGLGKRCHA